MIGGIYRETNYEVISEEDISERFKTENGVRQGCPISPTLCNLFLDDIDKEWEKRDAGGTVVRRLKFYTLKYADDITIVAENGGDLKRMLKIMEKFIREVKMKINVDKTKIMIFQNGRRRKKEKWELCEREVEVVNQFKYLGY